MLLLDTGLTESNCGQPRNLASRRISLQLATLTVTMQQPNYLRRIRLCLTLFITGLLLSGLTAFPIQTELRGLLTLLSTNALRPIAESTHLLPWIERVSDALTATNAHYPFLAYGTDWLAFGHLAIAIAFIGPYIDPIRNKWIVTFGLIACAGVIPLALIAGQIRGIPPPMVASSIAVSASSVLSRSCSAGNLIKALRSP